MSARFFFIFGTNLKQANTTPAPNLRKTGPTEWSVALHVCVYIYTYIFTGPLAVGVLDHSRVTQVVLSSEIVGVPPTPSYKILPWGGPGAKSRCAVAKV